MALCLGQRRRSFGKLLCEMAQCKRSRVVVLLSIRRCRSARDPHSPARQGLARLLSRSSTKFELSTGKAGETARTTHSKIVIDATAGVLIGEPVGQCIRASNTRLGGVNRSIFFKLCADWSRAVKAPGDWTGRPRLMLPSAVATETDAPRRPRAVGFAHGTTKVASNGGYRTPKQPAALEYRYILASPTIGGK